MITPYSLDHLKIPGLVHGFFDRHGGFCPAPGNTLNVAHGELVPKEAVAENRRAILEHFGVPMDLVVIRQVHGKKVHVVKKDDGRRDGMPEEDAFEADALCTDIPGKLLMIQTADCQAILLADPVKKVIAAVHSGWRGSVQNIAGETVRVMQEEFDSDPKDLLAGIGPSLGPCCAEFINWKKELPREFFPFRKDSDLFDFWAITTMQLENAGLLEEKISCLGMCTRCSMDWFSFRREQDTGRLAAVIGLVPESQG